MENADLVHEIREPAFWLSAQSLGRSLNLWREKIGRVLSFVVLFFALGGVVYLGRNFVKVQWHGIYVLEWAAVAWGTLTLVSGRVRDVFFGIRDIGSFWSFFIWGVFLLSIDLLACLLNGDRVSWQRIFQHGIIFVYPTVWLLIGLWIYRWDKEWSHFLLVTLFILNVVPNLSLRGVENISIGPLVAIPYSLILMAFLEKKHDRTLNWRWIPFLFLAIATFGSFWTMWLFSMQRTSLLLLLITVFGLPCGIAWKFNRPRSEVVRGIALSLLLLVSGMIWASNLRETARIIAQVIYTREVERAQLAARAQLAVPEQRVEIGDLEVGARDQINERLSSRFGVGVLQKALNYEKKHRRDYMGSGPPNGIKMMANDFLNSFQHGEDIPDKGEKFIPFQGRFRRFCWTQAVLDWWHSPLFGVRFIPEVPSLILPGVLNNGGYERKGAPPVSGPHNSYLSIFARMGVIGIILFGFGVVRWSKSALTLLKLEHGIPLTTALMIAIPLYGAVHALLNVGFEAPHHSVAMWVAAGMVIARSKILAERV